MKNDEHPPSYTADTKKQKRRSKPSAKKVNVKWPLIMTGVSFLLSVTMSFIASEALASVGILAAFFILIAIIVIGIIFDIIGTAATSADAKPFHSMAARRVKGATEAVWLTKNAEKVSNFCNDVVGDICGIISGTTSAVIVTRIVAAQDWSSIGTQLILSGAVAGLTIGGKALGKTFAIDSSTDILFAVGRCMKFFSSLSFKKSK